MKKIILCHRLHENLQGLGDEIALKIIAQGLRELGIDVSIDDNIAHLSSADFIFLCNTAFDLNPYYTAVSFLKKRYGVIAFQEDYIQYDGPSNAFFQYICNCLDDEKNFPLDALVEHPDRIYYFSGFPRMMPIVNYPVLKHAEICIANSKIEEKTIKRDCPFAKTAVVYWTSGLSVQDVTYLNNILNITGLTKGEYILQIGRFSLRKNQMASILATRHLDIPLVFISNHIFERDKKRMHKWIEAIVKWRKAPTFILTKELPSKTFGHLRIIQLEEEEFSTSLIVSAYQNAGLYLHPAFQELPGYVYLEAAQFGIPIVASHWATIKEYFADLSEDHITYCLPHHIQEIETAVNRQFGRQFSKIDLPIFKRTATDIGREILDCLS